MGKGSKTSTVTQSSEPAAYVQDAQKNYLDTVKNFTAPFTGTPPTNTVAGLTPDQMLSGDLARGMAENEFTGGPINYFPVTQFSQSFNPAAARSTALMPATSAGRTNLTGYAGGQVGPARINALLNPYLDNVLDPTIARMRRELGQTQAGIGARNASSAAFGGSRGALQSAEADRAFGDQVAETTGKLMAQGYDQATATALANAGRAQEVGMFNAGAANNMAQYNAGLRDKAISTNAAAMNSAAEADAMRRQQAAAANAAAENNMRQFNTGALQSGAITQNTLANDEASRQRSALAQLLGIGGQEQQTAQNSLNQPINMLKLLGAAIPGNYGETKTSEVPDNSPSALQTIGGLGLGLLGLPMSGGASLGGSLLGNIFSSLSDRRDKTDIKKLGDDPDTGLPMYAYRYKSDPKNTPKVVGPMAQDVERKYPGTVREVGGHKVIDGGALRALLGMT